MLAPLINEMDELAKEEIEEPLDCTKIIRLVQEKDVPWTTIEELIAEFNWDPAHVNSVLNSLIKEKIFIKKRESAEIGTRYYFPSLVKA